jgi:hypothetical protein
MKKLLEKYNASNINHAIRVIANIINCEQHLRDLVLLYSNPSANITEPGPTSGKTALNFAIEALSRYVVAVRPLDPAIIKLKLKVIDLCLLTFPEYSCIQQPQTIQAMVAMRKVSQEIIDKKLKNIVTPVEAFQLLTEQEIHLLTANVLLDDLLAIGKYNQQLQYEIGETVAKLDPNTRFARPILLLESHDDPAGLYFIQGLYKELLAAGYATAGVELYQGIDSKTLQEQFENSKKHDSSPHMKMFYQRLDILRNSGFETVLFDPRPHDIIRKDPRHFYNDLIRPIKFTEYFDVLHNLCNSGFTLAAKKQQLLHHGKVIFIAGCMHGRAMIRNAGSLPWNSFIISSPGSHSVAGSVESRKVYDTILLEDGAQRLELSHDATVRATQLQSFVDQNLSCYFNSPNPNKLGHS